MNALATLSSRHGRSVRQFIKFGLIGGAGVVVNLLTVAVAHNLGYHGLGVQDNDRFWPIPGTPYAIRYYHLYAIIAFLVANLFNFVWNRHWTFRHGDKAPFGREFWPFLLVGSVAQAAGLVILTLLKNPTSPFYLGHPFFTDDGAAITKRLYWAQLIQIVLVMPINFLVNKLWTFKAVRQRYAEPPAPQG